MDIITYHLDRILDFHVVPHTSSALVPFDEVWPYVDMRRQKLGGLTRDQVKAQLDCPRTKEDYLIMDGRKYLLGSLQIKCDYRNEPVLRSMFQKFEWRHRMPYCLAKGDCFVSNIQASKMYILDWILGTVDRNVNANFYGSIMHKQYRQGILVDNDRVWEAVQKDVIMKKVEECQRNSTIPCIHSSVLERFYYFLENDVSLSTKLIKNLKEEPLYKWSESYRSYVDQKDWSFLDTKVKSILSFAKKFKIPRTKNLPSDPSDIGMFSFYFG